MILLSCLFCMYFLDAATISCQCMDNSKERKLYVSVPQKIEKEQNTTEHNII